MKHKTTTPARLRVLAAALAAALLLGACVGVHSPYDTPALNLPAQYPHARTPANAAADAQATARAGEWWRNFGDPQLDALIDAALARNNDLAAATIRVRRAQLQAGLAADRLAPQFNGGLNANASRALRGDNATQHSASVSFGASYEVDLWNKLGSLRDVAQFEALATQQDRDSAALALVGTTATLYWQLAYLNQRLAAGRQGIDYAQKTLQLVQVQYRAGSVSGLEVAQAQQSVSAQQASQTQLEQQAVASTNALALLFDGQFAQLPPEVNTVPQALPDTALPPVDAGLPAELLSRRPDLRAAELRLREALANVDATRASFYPSLSLTGSLGSSSAALINVLSNPVLALGAGLSLPFLQRTQMDLTIKVSQAQYEEAVVAFRQQLYTALTDVDNALSARTQYAAQAVQLRDSLDAARKAESLFEIRYRAGSEPLKSWLDAQEKRRAAEIALSESRLNRLINHVTLYQALGGDAVVR